MLRDSLTTRPRHPSQFNGPKGCGAEASEADHEEIRSTAEDRHRRAARLFCGDERGRQRRSPGGRRSAQQSRGEFASAVSTTRESHAAVSKRADSAEIQLNSRPGPQSFQSGAPSRHEASLQAETLGRAGGVARTRGVDRRLRAGMSRHAQTTAVTLTRPTTSIRALDHSRTTACAFVSSDSP